MNAKQAAALNEFKRYATMGDRYEVKDIDFTECEGNAILVNLEIGMFDDEDKLSELLCRDNYLFFIGPRGGLFIYEGEKNYRAHYFKASEYRTADLDRREQRATETEPETAEPEEEAAPEYIEPEHIQTVSGHKIYRSIDPVTGWNVFTVTGRDFWELAEARYFAQCNPTEETNADNLEELEETISYRPTEPYHRYELLAYLGDCADDYDIDAIEDEATEWHDCDLYWRADVDLWEICERHELYQYVPAV